MGRASNSFTTWVGDPHTIGGQNSIPEERLFSAVLSQAVHDVFSEHVGKLDRLQAKEFLTQNTWYFKLVCEFAGRNPDYVTRKMKKRMQEDTPIPLFSKIRKCYRQANT
tara:strand:- start:146 stop:472 length:327 start_codon:yes stop_codon:yes gene_type:complete